LGMTSICFLACALLAVLGLAVFNSASMARRSTRLAVVQALGLSRGEVILSVAVEHIGILACSLLAGLAVGGGAARLYVPFMPLADTHQVLVPPFVALIDWSRALWLAAGVTLALVLTEVLVLARVARARVFEVLRLGARE
jgi:ABC-type antimicrobial peptide transport system permease subunit